MLKMISVITAVRDWEDNHFAVVIVSYSSINCVYRTSFQCSRGIILSFFFYKKRDFFFYVVLYTFTQFISSVKIVHDF